MKISLLFFSILAGLSVSLIVLMPLVPQRSIGRGFFRFNIFLSLFFLGFLAWLQPYENFRIPIQLSNQLAPSGQMIQISTILFFIFAIGSIFLYMLIGNPENKPPLSRRLTQIIYPLTIIVGVLAVITDSLLYRPTVGNWWVESLWFPIHFISSTLFLGTSLFAMLFGHWYLIQFDLDKKLLKRVALFFVFTLVFRLFTYGWGLYIFSHSPTLASDTFQSLTSLQGHGLFFYMQLFIGLVLPMVLAYMIFETAKMGANQACTGLLYIVVLFIFMGEATSRYLLFLKGIPL